MVKVSIGIRNPHLGPFKMLQSDFESALLGGLDSGLARGE
jgi:hypothetical protein